MSLVLGSALFGWQAVDLSMLACVPVLLAVSAFFAGSETALFGLSDAQRLAFRHAHPVAGRAVDALLADEGMLLITILLANTTVNVVYFVISAVLVMHADVSPAARTALSVVALLLLVLTGEIGPKMIVVSSARMGFTAVSAPVLLALHRTIGPLRLAISRFVIAPLRRLTAPHEPPSALRDDELEALLEVSKDEGIIDARERRLLREVLEMRRLRVRDVMTPRVLVMAVEADAGRESVLALATETRLTKVPVYEGDLDSIVGILHLKRYLLDPDPRRLTDERVMEQPHFVPDLITLDQLLDHFRRTRTSSAIVVDEYGGTEGIVSVEDVVEELVGDIVGQERAVAPPRLVGLGRWEIDGTLSVHRFAELFDMDVAGMRASSMSGLITEHLRRAPKRGDSIVIGPLRLTVVDVDRRRASAIVVESAAASASVEPPA